DRERDRLAHRHRPAEDSIGERFSAEQLHRDEERLALFTDLEDLADVGMTDGGRRSRLAEQPPPGRAILGRGDDLQRNVAIQAEIARPIHLAHASGAEERDDFVRGEPRTGRDRHRRYFSRIMAAGSTPPEAVLTPCAESKIDVR